MKINKILEKEIERIKPSDEENKKFLIKINSIIESLNKKLKGKAHASLGGSFAKNTVIKKDKYDADIFVRFRNDKNSSDVLEKVLKAIRLKAERIPGSRDYFSAKIDSLSLEIVPILDINKVEKAVNVTDVSPFHVLYIKKKIESNKKLADEIRLAKAFCYANECYGAESHIRGFSGYCLEVLIAHYKSFVNLLKAAAKWNEKVVIDPAKYYKNKDEILREINESKIVSPLVLIDPVQKDRNVAAAISEEKFLLFIEQAKKFLKKPSDESFKKRDVEKEILKRVGRGKLIVMNAESTKTKDDIAGAKLLKFYRFLLMKLEKSGYPTKSEIKFYDNSAKFFFITEKKDSLVPGPFIEMKEHVEAFKNKWKRTVIKGKRLFAIRKASEMKKPEEILKIDSKILRDMAIKNCRIQSKR